MENRALIGYSGFVGQTLLKQTGFDELYRSTNIGEIKGRSFDTVVCAGAPAVKWKANKEPQKDKDCLSTLIESLRSVRCKHFILISTVDVFKSPVGVDEKTAVSTDDLHPYGLHRYELENFVRENFEEHLIVRLPGLVGPGLKKNVIFDFLNDNNLNAVDSRAVFQFYPMINLWSDIQKASDAGLRLIHLTAEPVSVGEIAREGFGIEFSLKQYSKPASYDFRSINTGLYGSESPYQYSRKEVMLAIRAYAQSETRSIGL